MTPWIAALRTLAMRRILYSVTVAAFMAAVCGCTFLQSAARDSSARGDATDGPSGVSAESLAAYSRGVQHDLRGEAEPALAAYREAIALDPHNGRAYQRLIHLHRQADGLARAAEELAELARDYPDAAPAHRWNALLAYHVRKDADAAIRSYRRAIKLQPADEESYRELASLHARRKQWKLAARVIQDGLGRVDSDRGLITLAGELYVNAREAGAREEAEHFARILNESIRKQEEPADLMLLSAIVYASTDETNKVTDVLERAVRKHPGNPDVHIGLANHLINQNKLDEAAQRLDAAVSSATNAVEIHRQLGRLFAARAYLAEDADQARSRREKAVDHLNRVAASRGDDIAALYELGKLHALLENYDRALEYLQEAERLSPGNLTIKESLVQTLIADDRKTEAIDRLKTMAEDQPRNTALMMFLGRLYQDIGETGEAANYFEQAIDTEPSNPAPYMKLAYLLLEDDQEAAIRVLENAIDVFGDQPRLYEMLAYIHLSREEYEESIALFEKARAIPPPDGEAEDPAAEFQSETPFFALHYTIALQKAGHTERATDEFLARFREDESFLPVYFQMIQSYAASNTDFEAAAVLHRAAEDMPDRPYLHIYQGLLYSVQKKYEPSLSALLKAESLIDWADKEFADLRPQMHFWLGSVRERLGQIDEAIDHFERCIEWDPEFAEAYNYIAYMWAERGIHLTEAMELVAEALKLDPENGAFIDTRGWIHYQQAEYEKALEDLERAHRLLPEDATVMEHLGDVYDKLGWPGKALEYWRKAMELGPEKPEELQLKIEAMPNDEIPKNEE